ncbi:MULTISPECIES: DUF535 family protein [Cupriavidus]
MSSLQWLSAIHARGLFHDIGPFLYFRYLAILSALTAFCYPQPGVRWRVKRVKLFCRSAFRFAAVRAWLQAVDACALLRHAAAARPALLERPYRPLAMSGLGFRERMRTVLDHYRTLSALVPMALGERICAAGGLACAFGEGRYALRLADSGPNPKEGELAFYWQDTASGTCLSQLSFYFRQGGEGAEIFVGGLQGPMGENSRDLIRESTKACDGLRPKDVVMEALLALAAALGVRRIVGVSRQNHVGRQRHTPREILCDYESFWTECGGAPLGCGNIGMPVGQPRRDVMELPSRKRAAYRRKQARADGIQAAVQGWLAMPAAMPAPAPMRAGPPDGAQPMAA